MCDTCFILTILIFRSSAFQLLKKKEIGSQSVNLRGLERGLIEKYRFEKGITGYFVCDILDHKRCSRRNSPISYKM